MHRYADPRRAEGHCTGARQNIFSFPPGAAHFLFDVSKRKWGAHCPAGNPARFRVQWDAPLAETGSKASFCIYLTHLFFLDSLAVRGISAGTLPPIWGVPVLVAVAFGGGFLVWLVLRRVPVVNTYLI